MDQSAQVQTHILVATDLSEEANCALETAATLAQAMGACLSAVVCVIPIAPVPSFGVVSAAETRATVTAALRESAEARLKVLVAKYWPGLAVKAAEVLTGVNEAETICEYAREQHADWVVVGTHGRTGLRHMLIGSVAERVVRHAPCHVVVARSAHEPPAA